MTCTECCYIAAAVLVLYSVQHTVYMCLAGQCVLYMCFTSVEVLKFYSVHVFCWIVLSVGLGQCQDAKQPPPALIFINI